MWETTQSTIEYIMATTRMLGVMTFSVLLAMALSTPPPSLADLLGLETIYCDTLGRLNVASQQDYPVDCFLCAKKVNHYDTFRKCCLNISAYVKYCETILGKWSRWTGGKYRSKKNKRKPVKKIKIRKSEKIKFMRKARLGQLLLFNIKMI